ncbi:AbrB/MazE/SpoVT family DNA-binding domain-containing protein [Haloarcula laminariae]|uniref:AbrB/MazE/SpoVT family DNA-binding domain-containing protein n=1 Tax=Haloarcula laminariae TaxID=2961577 RepID=UPI0021C7CD68|nr:AbrB/MazE/SpoVT family DNA-binding domain-containing protein [Halomicroarcula laminariae]
METRKIQQVGGGTYTVSLPKEWATAADIEPGAVVALHSHIDGTLVVQTGVESESEPLTLSVDDADPAALERTLRAAYTAGVDSVELVSSDGVTESTHRRVDRVTRTLTGVTVTESGDDGMQVRSLLDVEEVSITQSVRQLQFAALSAHREATAALTTASADAPAGQADGTDRIAAMVDHYFQRGLDSLSVMDALGLTRPELFDRWVTARELARVADHADRIEAVADRLDEPVDAEVIDDVETLADRSRDLVQDAVGVVLDGNGETAGGADDAPEAVQGLLDERDRLCSDIDEFDRRLFETDAADYRLTHAVDAVRGTAEAAGQIAEVGLQSLLRERCSSAGMDVE